MTATSELCIHPHILTRQTPPAALRRNVNAGLAGFVDALVMGWRDAHPGRLTSQPTHVTSTDSEACKDGPQQRTTRSASGLGLAAVERDGGAGGSSLGLGLGLGPPSTPGPDEMAFDHELTPVKTKPRVARRIFSTTYNMGGSGGVLDPSEVAGWIPLDYDLYAIGLQECERVPEVAAAVQRRLGGSLALIGGQQSHLMI